MFLLSSDPSASFLTGIYLNIHIKNNPEHISEIIAGSYFVMKKSRPANPRPTIHRRATYPSICIICGHPSLTQRISGEAPGGGGAAAGEAGTGGRRRIDLLNDRAAAAASGRRHFVASFPSLIKVQKAISNHFVHIVRKIGIRAT